MEGAVESNAAAAVELQWKAATKLAGGSKVHSGSQGRGASKGGGSGSGSGSGSCNT